MYEYKKFNRLEPYKDVTVLELYKNNNCLKTKFDRKPIPAHLDSIEELDEILVTENSETLNLDNVVDESKRDLTGQSSLVIRNSSGLSWQMSNLRTRELCSQITIARNAYDKKQQEQRSASTSKYVFTFYSTTWCFIKSIFFWLKIGFSTIEDRINHQSPYYVTKLSCNLTIMLIPVNYHYIRINLYYSSNMEYYLLYLYSPYLKSPLRRATLIIILKITTVTLLFDLPAKDLRTTQDLSLRSGNDKNRYDALLKTSYITPYERLPLKNSPIYLNSVSLNKENDEKKGNEQNSETYRKKKRKYRMLVLPSKIRPVSSQTSKMTILKKTELDYDDDDEVDEEKRLYDRLVPAFAKIATSQEEIGEKDDEPTVSADKVSSDLF